jgi:hypothetical protein
MRPTIEDYKNIYSIKDLDMKTDTFLEVKPKQIAWFDDHFYQVGDEFYPSVTTILGAVPKSFLSNWRGQVGNWEADRIMNEAMDKGSRIHNAVSVFLSGGTILFNNPKAPSYIDIEIEAIKQESKGFYLLQNQQEMLELYRFQQFFDKVKPQVIATDLNVYSPKLGYAGSLDIIFDIKVGDYEVNGAKPIHIPEGRYICDLKTGANIDDNYYSQIAAYMVAYEENGHELEISGGLIIHTNSKTQKGIEGFSLYQRNRDELEDDFQRFLKYKAIFDMNGTNKPKIFNLPGIIKMGAL